MLELTLRGSFNDLPSLAAFLTQLVHAGIRPDTVEAEPNEPTGSITNPLLKAQPAPAVGPFGAPAAQTTEPKRRGRKPAAAAVLDQPQPQPAAGPFTAPVTAMPSAAPTAAAPFAAPPAAAPQAFPSVTFEMLQVKISEAIGLGKMEPILGLFKEFGVRMASDIPETRRGEFYAKLLTI